ncbi:32 kDa beta-galactoside-binding lectin-like [Haliotis rubra]|uniref:32 kDa beta-galactoside-binding lectin-like n=1 Tax=Haliotis rubra TaxID=36100 RepID=UPI001EE596A3|nr:32 kDa beta-galactoside-binding lectin-like [Haliotis rubra]
MKFQLIMNGAGTEATRWSIRIEKQADKLFFLELRLGYNTISNVIVINTVKDGVWGTEERFDLAMAVGKTMEIQITLQDGVYELVIDGAIIHHFTERDPGAKPDHFAFLGDVSVSMMKWMS